jgi:hypothetical protein
MNADFFFRLGYVKRKRRDDGRPPVFYPHDGLRVTIWPRFADLHEWNPESNSYHLWAKWWMIRFVPWTTEDPADYLVAIRTRLSSFHEEIPDLPEPSSSEFAPYLVRLFNIARERDPVAQEAYRTMTVAFTRVNRIRNEIRQELNPADEPPEVENENDGIEAHAVVPAEHLNDDHEMIPPALIETRKRPLLPEIFANLDDDTLEEISRNARIFFSQINSNPPSQPIPNIEITPRTLNAEQQRAFDLFINPDLDSSLFVSGGPGAGKTTLIKNVYFEIQSDSLTTGSLLVTATTGKAASLLRCRAVTIHSALMLHIKGPLSDEQRATLKARLSRIKLIIVDEASMLGCSLLDAVLSRLREFPCESRRTRDGEDLGPFGGYRLMFTGDFAMSTCQMWSSVPYSSCVS